MREYQSSRDEELEIEWRPFDLQSSRRDSNGELKGSSGMSDEHFERAKQKIKALEERYGADMSTYDARNIDSLKAQIASYYVKENYSYSTWLKFDESIFNALWKNEQDIGDEDILLELAEEAGVDTGELEKAFEDEGLREEVMDKFDEAKEQMVNGVPTFVYGENVARGAVPPEKLKELVEN